MVLPLPVPTAPPPGNRPPPAPLTSLPAARGTCLHMGHSSQPSRSKIPAPSMALWPGLWWTPGPQASNSDLLQLLEPGPGVFSVHPPPAPRYCPQVCCSPVSHGCFDPQRQGTVGIHALCLFWGVPAALGSFFGFLLSYPLVRPVGENFSNYRKACLHREACFHRAENSY